MATNERQAVHPFVAKARTFMPESRPHALSRNALCSCGSGQKIQTLPRQTFSDPGLQTLIGRYGYVRWWQTPFMTFVHGFVRSFEVPRKQLGIEKWHCRTIVSELAF